MFDDAEPSLEANYLDMHIHNKSIKKLSVIYSLHWVHLITKSFIFQLYQYREPIHLTGSAIKKNIVSKLYYISALTTGYVDQVTTQQTQDVDPMLP